MIGWRGVRLGWDGHPSASSESKCEVGKGKECTRSEVQSWVDSMGTTFDFLRGDTRSEVPEYMSVFTLQSWPISPHFNVLAKAESMTKIRS